MGCEHASTAALAAWALRGTATAAANAFRGACDGGTPVTPDDWRAYMNVTWLRQAAISSCANFRRFGSSGDGGKAICDADRTLNADGCLLVSVGLDGDTKFEQAVHRASPG